MKSESYTSNVALFFDSVSSFISLYIFELLTIESIFYILYIHLKLALD